MSKEIKNVLNNGVKTIDSREVAEMMGKSHSALLKMIDGSKDGNAIGIKPVLEKSNFDLSDYFIKSSYKSGNRDYKCYLCTEKGCEMLGNKLQGEKGVLFTAKYVEAFHEMKDTIKEVDNTIKTKGKLSNYEWNNIKRNSKYLTEYLYDRKSVKKYLDNYDKLRLNEAVDEIYEMLKQVKGCIKYGMIEQAVKELTKFDNELDFSNPMNTYIKTMCKEGIIKLDSLHIKKLKRKIK